MRMLLTHGSLSNPAAGDVVGPYVVTASYAHLKKGLVHAHEVAKPKVNEDTLPAPVGVRRDVCARATVRVRHPNVISAGEALRSGRRLHLLSELVRSGDYNRATVRYTFRQLVDAVLYAHTRGAYHGNLRPESLLIAADGQLKVVGFGQPVQLHPLYSAPELADGESHSLAAADAWGVGVVLYWLLAGELPFAECGHATRAVVVYPPLMPPDAVDLVAALMDPDPATRLDLAAVERHPWFVRDERQPRKTLPRDAKQYSEHQLGDVVRAAVPGRAARVVDKVVHRLQAINIERGDDLALLATLFDGPKRLAAWFEEIAGLPTFTAVRLARFLYARE